MALIAATTSITESAPWPSNYRRGGHAERIGPCENVAKVTAREDGNACPALDLALARRNHPTCGYLGAQRIVWGANLLQTHHIGP